MKLTVTVDGGGTGCRLAAFDAYANLHAQATSGPASLSLGEEQTWRHINEGLSSIRQQLNLPASWQPACLSMGLAGALQTRQRAHFLSLIPSTIKPILITDGHAQLLGATAGKPGVCLAVGTGSVLHWLDENNNIHIAGGWGYPMGDEGSGAWLGFQLINAYLWHRDTRRPDTPAPEIFQALEARIGTEISDIQAWSTQTRSTEVATLAPLIVSSASKDDTLANSLLDQGAKQCQRLLELAPGTLPIHLVGGLADIYKPRINSTLTARLKPPQGNALNGLYTLSLIHNGSNA